MWRGVERRFSISAPQMRVRPHIAWYLRWGMMLPFVFASVGLAWWAYDSGLELAGFHRGQTLEELAKLREQVAKLEAENVQLSDLFAQSERQIQIEQASNRETTNQLKNLSDDNVHLQEDLVFFQNLTATHGKEGELAIHRLKLERDKMPGEYHLRMLLVQSGERAKKFNGSYQLVATVVEDQTVTTHVFPQESSGNAQFQLGFKYYQRVEQSIQLPADAELKNVQVRIFEQGSSEPKVRQAVNPS
ncbi:MAG: DUF6776 family protein [Gallionella sp.]